MTFSDITQKWCDRGQHEGDASHHDDLKTDGDRQKQIRPWQIAKPDERVDNDDDKPDHLGHQRNQNRIERQNFDREHDLPHQIRLGQQRIGASHQALLDREPGHQSGQNIGRIVSRYAGGRRYTDFEHHHEYENIDEQQDQRMPDDPETTERLTLELAAEIAAGEFERERAMPPEDPKRVDGGDDICPHRDEYAEHCHDISQDLVKRGSKPSEIFCAQLLEIEQRPNEQPTILTTFQVIVNEAVHCGTIQEIIYTCFSIK